MSNIKNKNTSGFTLVELLAVIVILAILATIGVPIVANIINNSKTKINLNSANSYIRAVEVAINMWQLDDEKILDGVYEIKKNGNVCIGEYDKSNDICNGKILNVETKNKPAEGTLTIKNNLIVKYSLTINNVVLSDELMIDEDEQEQEQDKEQKPTDASCFKTRPNYDYDINPTNCVNYLGDLLNSNFNSTEAAGDVCSKGTKWGDLINIASYGGYTIEQLQNFGIISNVSENNTLSISGYTCGGSSGIKDVVIPSMINNKQVTKIAMAAFVLENPMTGETYDKAIINSIVIPDSVKNIEYAAFDSNDLEHVTIGNGVEVISRAAFYDNQLTSVSLGTSVKTIGVSAFSNNQLKNVTIASNVKIIEDDAFSRNHLTSVTIGDSVETIGASAFQRNQLKSVILGKGVTTIGKYAFEYNELTSVTIPDSVTIIGEYAFYANKLTTVKIGTGITSVGNMSFGAGTTIDDGITWGPNAIKNVYINSSESSVTVENGAFGMANGYEGNIHWNSSGPTG